jgi:hypothetical protein
MTEDEIEIFVKERRTKLNRLDEIIDELGIDPAKIRKDQIKNKVKHRTEKAISKMESDLNEVRKKINDRDSNKSKQESYKNDNNNYEYINKNYEERNEDMIQLEKAIELHNQSREILNKLLDKKLKDHTQYYWIQKGILTSQIGRLVHQRDSLHIRTLMDALKKMEE